MKTDSQIKQDVLDELAWQSSVDETQIGVIVKDGIVTLNGVVDSYAKKMAAERAAKSVYGVKAVAEDIIVNFKEGEEKTDTEIAKSVVDVVKWNSSLPEDKIQIKVENAWVYLSGEVEWSFQKTAAKTAIEHIHGVKGVVNNIVIKQRVEPEVKDRITKAFERSADIEAKNIQVDISGGVVTLSGTVHSIAEKEEARRATFFAPGVTKVINNLKVKFYPEYV